MKKKPKLNIPNLLSIMRILIIPLIIIYFFNDRLWESLVLLAVSAVSDVVDGKIARKYNQITDLGKVLDPIADKLTLFAVIFCLWTKYGHQISGLPVLFCVLIGKDLLMMAGGLIFFNFIKKPVGSLWFGKMSTVVFYAVTLSIILLDVSNVNLELKNTLIFILVLISAAASVTALVMYVIYACKVYEESCTEKRQIHG